MWERYCRGVNAIVYMVDSADSQKIEVCYFKVCNLQFLDHNHLTNHLTRQVGQN